MARSAGSPQSSAARKLQGASPMRPVRNLPSAQMAANDNARARNFVKERQGRILPTIMTPANDNVSQDDDEDIENDIYGASQRAADDRMRDFNAGDQEQTYDDQSEYDLRNEAIQDDQNNERALSAPELDQRRAQIFHRERAASALANREDGDDEATSAAEAKARFRKAAIKKASQRFLVKAGFGSTGVGLIVTLLIWDYEVFIEKGAPTWKIFLVVTLHILNFLLFILQILLPFIIIGAIMYGAYELLPAPLQSIVDLYLTS